MTIVLLPVQEIVNGKVPGTGIRNDSSGLNSLWHTSRSSELIPPELPDVVYCQKDQLLNTPVALGYPTPGGLSVAGFAPVPIVCSHKS